MDSRKTESAALIVPRIGVSHTVPESESCYSCQHIRQLMPAMPAADAGELAELPAQHRPYLTILFLYDVNH